MGAPPPEPGKLTVCERNAELLHEDLKQRRKSRVSSDVYSLIVDRLFNFSGFQFRIQNIFLGLLYTKFFISKHSK